MEYDGRYDDPKTIQAFLDGMENLVLIDRKQAQNLVNESAAADNANNNKNTDTSSDRDDRSGSDSPAFVSAVSSPVNGTRAPPPTPETTLLPNPNNIEHLPSIEEDHSEGRKRNQLIGTKRKYSHPLHEVSVNMHPALRALHDASTSTNTVDAADVSLEDVDLADYEGVNTYQADALPKFQHLAKARYAIMQAEALENAAVAAEHGDIPPQLTQSSDTESSVAEDGCAECDCGGHQQNISPVATEPFPEMQDDPTAIAEDSSSEDGDDGYVNIIVDAPSSFQPSTPPKSAAIAFTPEKTVSRAAGATGHEEGLNANAKEFKSMEGQSREHATYFSTWGSPSTRTAAPARARKVLIYGLPFAADFSFVQSLIHGGAIEEMLLSQNSSGPAIAQVTFTDANACEAYVETYKNGLEFKYSGRKHVAVVKKAEQVSVVSGMLQSWLACGASRVVMVAGADEDWAVKALYKIAEGPFNRRKVETVVDSYRNDSRTIIFRFTKISDAVTFRGELLRQADWQDADIRFMADPCEKATGLHWD